MVTRQELLDYTHALNKAVAMLARRPCSKKEIADRLLRAQFPEETISLVLYKLEKEKLLNDESFCEQWIRYRLSGKYGPAVIRRELRMKGIPEDMMDAAFEAFPPNEEEDNALHLAVKTWKRVGMAGDLRKNRQKVISALVRKGYDWETARSACRRAEEESAGRL